MEFVMGADVSSLQAMEDHGAKYYDFDGTEKDALEILKLHGINCIRLRLWNHPTTSFDDGDYCDLKHTIVMAKRIKDMGLGFMLDFHYSDSWADWKCQNIPSEWVNQGADELSDSVYHYTTEVLQLLNEHGAYPDIVQIGNEIGKGMLWDYGKTDHPDQLANFLNAGIQAVRDMNSRVEAAEVVDAGIPTDHPAKIMIHIESGGDVRGTEAFFTMIEQNGVTDYDLIGLSYYPYWAGSYEMLKRNLRNVKEKFDKPVILAEIAFPYTDVSHDDMPNMVTSEVTNAQMGLSASRENQRKVISEIIHLVRSERNGGGIFYWEPVWYCKKGVGAAKGMGNEWENQALFDEKGRPTEGLLAFEDLEDLEDSNTLPCHVVK